MRPFNVYFLPDLWNNWHWSVYDANSRLVAESDRSHFHLIDAQKEAEAAMLFCMVS